MSFSFSLWAEFYGPKGKLTDPDCKIFVMLYILIRRPLRVTEVKQTCQAFRSRCLLRTGRSSTAGYCFDVTKSENGGVKSIRNSLAEVASSWTSLRSLDDLLSMANQRKDAGTDSWWETYQPFFFLQAQAEEEVKGERADILNELHQEKDDMAEAENEKLLEKLKDLMVAERAPDAFQLEIKLHMDRGLIRR